MSSPEHVPYSTYEVTIRQEQTIHVRATSGFHARDIAQGMFPFAQVVHAQQVPPLSVLPASTPRRTYANGEEAS